MSQLLYIVHNIRKNWCEKNITHGLFLDVSSAFEKVWHQGKAQYKVVIKGCHISSGELGKNVKSEAQTLVFVISVKYSRT